MAVKTPPIEEALETEARVMKKGLVHLPTNLRKTALAAFAVVAKKCGADKAKIRKLVAPYTLPEMTS